MHSDANASRPSKREILACAHGPLPVFGPSDPA